MSKRKNELPDGGAFFVGSMTIWNLRGIAPGGVFFFFREQVIPIEGKMNEQQARYEHR